MTTVSAETPPAAVEVDDDPRDGSMLMKVGSSTNPQSLASAISHAVYDGRTVTLRSIGAGGINQAVKAVAIARGFCAPRGFDLAMIPGFTTVPGESGEMVSATTLRIIQQRH